MKNIEITTSQNVTIQYGLATPVERVLALALDLLFMGVGSLLLWGFVSLFSSAGQNIMFYFTILPFLLLYTLLFEQLNNGQSLGKRTLGIRVIRLDGETTRFQDYLMRWMFRALDIYFSFGGVAILSVVSSRYSQRLGDLLANTVVVNVGKTERMSLQNLMRLHEMKHHKITYPQVVKMPEEAMLLVKQTLVKRIELDNDAYEEAFNLLVKKMEKELKVKAPADRELFLKTLLNDYIVLTR